MESELNKLREILGFSKKKPITKDFKQIVRNELRIGTFCKDKKYHPDQEVVFKLPEATRNGLAEISRLKGISQDDILIALLHIYYNTGIVQNTTSTFYLEESGYPEICDYYFEQIRKYHELDEEEKSIRDYYL